MKYLLFLLVLPVLSLAQEYYEASGQTRPFTLTAGAKATWDPSIAVEKVRMDLPGTTAMTLYPNPSNGTLRISVLNAKGPAMVAIYSITGKKVRNLILNQKREATIERPLANGIYFAKLAVNGRMVQTTRFLVVR